MGEMVSFQCPNAKDAAGYLARAAGDGRRGIIVLQEWWGLNDQIKGVADRFAAAGFSALAPDLYAGRVAQDPDEANHLMTGLDWVGATEQEVRGAVQYLQGMCDKVAVSGFCMGGALTIIAAVKIPEVDAGVCYYGIPPAEQADPAGIRVPFQGHFATRDDWCTPQAVSDLQATLESAGVDYELFRYDGEHGFMNEARPEVFEPEASAKAFERSIAFLQTKLG